MRPKSSTSGIFVGESSIRTHSRSATPIENTFLTSTRAYTPYPLYKQKVRTLLKPPDYSRQPPNFMSARETRADFEKKEASLQVKLLKKTFNMMKEEYNSGNRRMDMLISESIRVSELEHVGQHDIEYLETRLKKLEIEERKMLDITREEFNNNLVYRHVRERLRQTLMHLELKNQYLQDQIRLRDFLIDGEHRKKIKTLENKFTMVQAYKNLAKTVNLDKKDRSLDLGILEDDIEARKKIHELRQKRMKKYEEIAENAAIEEGDKKSMSIREGHLLHKAWAKFLAARFVKEKERFAPIDEAFKKIKAATTISNPKEVVEKFLMKEERLSSLMSSLNDSRTTCTSYRIKNDNLEQKISDYLLTQKEGKNMDISNLKNLIEQKTLKINQLKEKKNRLFVTRQTLREWALKKIKMMKKGWRPREETIKQIYQILASLLKNKVPKSSPFITDI